MGNIILIACVKIKLDVPARAADLYTSTLFHLNLAYASQLQPDAIYVLSAKYGLLELDQVIEPYEKTLNKMCVYEKRVWPQQVLADLRRKADPTPTASSSWLGSATVSTWCLT